MPAAPPVRIVLDTNILVHYVRGDALAQRIEARYGLTTAPTAPLISVVTVGEMRSFALQLGWGATKVKQLRHLLDACVVVQLDLPGIIDAYARIDFVSRRDGKRMGKNDIWIGATAHVTRAHLLTTDHDFDHLDPTYLHHEWIDPHTT